MSRVLILHSSFDGQTARIAARIGETLARLGHSTSILSADSDAAFDRIAAHDAVIIGAAVRYGHHSRDLAERVKRSLPAIDARPNAFFSVCLAATHPGPDRSSVEGPLRDFESRTGWTPGDIAVFAGALRYRAYNPFIRLMMRFIVSRAGGDTDTSRDYEYTDWGAVIRFAADFAASLDPRAKAA
jgi:menaquinone-dependent protoporphyrinogen oxidase